MSKCNWTLPASIIVRFAIASEYNISMHQLRLLNSSRVALIRILLLVLSVTSEETAVAGPASAVRRSAPNIIFILIDDQRYDFLSFLDHPWIRTPHIDRLARNSMYFKHAFVTTSLCSPSRASILTGQYAHRHGVLSNDIELPPGIATFPQELQRQGYRTSFIGKWHMGGNNPQPRPGFDEWVSFRGQGDYNNPRLNVNGREVTRQGYTPDILTEYAVAFIRANATANKPYCLYLSHQSVHEPFTPAARHAGVYQDLKIPRPPSFEDSARNYQGKPIWLKRQRTSWHGAERDFAINQYGDFDRFFQKYSECMLAVDDSVGQIAETLRQLGQLEDTAIIYFSDNGYHMGEHGLIDKRVMYEESIRVPCFVHFPRLIPAPSTNSDFILNIDLAPTILELAGMVAPQSMQGVSFLPLLRNEKIPWREDFLYEYFVDPNTPQTPTIFGLRTQRHSYMTYQGVWDLFELYDMERDPAQRLNLLGNIQHGQDYGQFVRSVELQDPAIHPVVQELQRRMEARLQQTGGSLTPSWKLDAAGVGTTRQQ